MEAISLHSSKTASRARPDHRGKKYVSLKKQEAATEFRKYQRHKRKKGSVADAEITPKQERTNKATRFTQAELLYKNKKEKQRLKSDAIKKNDLAREEKRKKYQQQKRDKFLKLCRRTHKGQPVMKYQMDHLLSKIQKLV